MQALADDRPVLGVCSNIDQFLTMNLVEAAGAGIALRADRLTEVRLEAAIGRLQAPSFAEAARSLGRDMESTDVRANLLGAVRSLIG